ncbi:type II and III secretion system protein family protein [Acetobacter cibinongensis]|uniref:type II and III secretion system protein family protein n=1 Tax=Acetobacter cibinongensis TaxID=146475 RepID=UPI000A3C5EF6|nr:type II and III secretion system protein family protein [Acetobacter cibinongensis]
MSSKTVAKKTEPAYNRALKLVFLGLTSLSGFLYGPAGFAGTPGMGHSVSTRGGQALDLAVGAGRLLSLSQPTASVFVADPQIADVQIPSDDKIFILGKKSGTTTLFALDESGNSVSSWTIRVEADQTAFTPRAQTESEHASLQTTPNGSVITGSVANADQADHLATVARGIEGKEHPLANQMGVTHPLQVNLRIRIAEVSRSVAQQIGFNWSTVIKAGSFAFGLQSAAIAENAASSLFGGVSSSSVNAQTVLDAMANEHLVTLLAEPNLTAISGSTATFLAGGEFPIPVPQALGVTSIQYMQYGVSLAFTPTVLGAGLIHLKVRPTVSALSGTGSYQLNNLSVPALTTRQAQTEVELASGESFAIAGLLRNDADNNVQKFPILGDIPILGQLFRSSRFQRDQSELVIIITPYLVKPVDPLHTPDDPLRHVHQPSELERFFYGRMADQQDLERMPHLNGTGFVFE